MTPKVLEVGFRPARRPPPGDGRDGPDGPRAPPEPGRGQSLSGERDAGGGGGQGGFEERHLVVAHDLDRDLLGRRSGAAVRGVFIGRGLGWIIGHFRNRGGRAPRRGGVDRWNRREVRRFVGARGTG